MTETTLTPVTLYSPAPGGQSRFHVFAPHPTRRDPITGKPSRHRVADLWRHRHGNAPDTWSTYVIGQGASLQSHPTAAEALAAIGMEVAR